MATKDYGARSDVMQGDTVGDTVAGSLHGTAGGSDENGWTEKEDHSKRHNFR